MPLSSVLKHLARPVGKVARVGLDPTDFVYGDAGTVEEAFEPFRCVIFLPQGTETATGRGRQVREPTMLYQPYYPDGGAVGLKPEASLEVQAPELNVAEGLSAAEWVRWDVAGAPLVAGKPGKRVKVMQVTLRRVTE